MLQRRALLYMGGIMNEETITYCIIGLLVTALSLAVLGGSW